MNFFQIASVIIIHFLFDWVLQSREDAVNKGESYLSLSHHVLNYSIGLLLLGLCLFPLASPFLIYAWAMLNAVLHFLTDAITSRLNKRFYPKASFWYCIGADQAIHYLTLFGTYFLFV